MAITIARRRFTVADYHKMAETGILAYKERVELIDGEIVEMTPIGRRHMACVDRLNRFFVRALGDEAIVRVQGSLRLGEHSEPEPDLAILRPRADFYADSDAGPADTLLIVEVADTSEHYDRLVKVPLYARAGIPEVWLVDLNAATVTVYRQPAAGGYAEAIVAAATDELRPLAFSDFTLSVASIFG
jgi:Uma2 family endonuclease